MTVSMTTRRGCWSVVGLILGLTMWASLCVAEEGKPLSSSAAQQLYDLGKFDEALAALDAHRAPDTEESHAAMRLRMLTLAQLKKASESLDVYHALIKAAGRNDEALLRQLAFAFILPLRADMREQVRGAAYTALKETELEDVTPYLEEGLGDGSGMIRALAAEGLGRLESGRRSQRFHNALKDKAAFVRATVVKALARSGDRDVQPLIQPLLKDEQGFVQVAAAGGMVLLGHDQYWERVKQGAEQNEGYERGAAYQMLGELGGARALPLLTKGMLDVQPSLRASVIAAIGKLDEPQAVPMLLQALTGRNPAVRSVAAVSLGRAKSERAIPYLTKALGDTNPGVRAAAVAALLQLNSPFGVVAPTVSELMVETNPGLRSGIAKALGHGQGRDAIGTLLLLLKDPVPKPRITAARSLGRIGDRRMVPQLTRALADQDDAVRATVAAAILRLLSSPNQL